MKAKYASQYTKAGKLERLGGFEPPSSAWKAEAQPIYHNRIKDWRKAENTIPTAHTSAKGLASPAVP